MPLRHTLLGLLHWAPMHGYLLRQHAREYSWIYPMTNANIYPALHSLEQGGFVTHETEIHNGRARKTYQISRAGREELGRWLIDPTAQDLTFRDQMLLKISMLSDRALEGAKVWIEASLQKLRAEVAEADENLANAGEMSTYTRLTMEYGVDMMRLRIQFLELVLAENAGEVAETAALSRL